MATLNKAQKEAVSHVAGPLLVLAGPGSGKTMVITHRAVNLIEKAGVDPAKILVITFTRAAAEEMKNRFFEMYSGDDEAHGITFSTFHALFFSVLRAAYGYSGANILRPEQKQQMFYEIMDELRFDVEDQKDFMEKLEAEISLVKGEGILLDNYYPMNCPKDVFVKAFNSYEDKLKRRNLIDFDDMQLMCYELMVKRPVILKLWQDRYEYIMVDEVQDTNLLQYRLIKLLSDRHRNLMMVGDDDQSIYRFRGAKPEIMLSFSRDYPEGKKIVLDINYRSAEQIVVMANRLIKKNSTRYDKDLRAFRTDKYEAVTMRAFEDVKEQNQAVYDRIRQLHEEGERYSDIAVLFRTNLQPRSLVELLLRNNLPFSMRDVLPNIYEHWIFRDIKAYLDMAYEGVDRRNLLQIINRPKRYIARDICMDENISLDSIREFYKDKEYVIERIDRLEADLNMLRGMKPYAAVHYIRHVIGYEEFLGEYAQFRNLKLEELLDVFDELEESAMPYKNYDEYLQGISDFKMRLKQQNLKKEKRGDEVSLMTYHSSKGLEFKHVFLIDVNDKITPYKKATTPADLEEERRMFYVAFTRARGYVYISWTNNRYNKKCDVSPYIGELLISPEAFREGTRVYHEVYKEGVITAVSGNKLTVKFDSQKMDRKLDLSFCVQNRILRPIE
ncbi:MAG: ATP-dependent helicase [Lachnospiraceae bacterium]|nr:ATP-dependent helicase [Lachnospiraceae bacterium]